MNKEILIMYDDNMPFLLMRMKSKFDGCGWVVEDANLNFKALERRNSFPKLIFAQAEDLNKHSDSLVYLADQCLQSGSKMAVLGYPSDLEEFKASVSPSIVVATFTRPIDVNIVVDKITEVYGHLTENLTKKNILVVDDSAVFLRTMMGWLSDKYQVTVAPSAAAAFNMINNKMPDLILLDYEMPICSGTQFLEMLRSEVKTESIPVIFLTSRGDGQTVREVISLKPQGYLLKTQPKDKILKSIEDFFIQLSLKN